MFFRKVLSLVICLIIFPVVAQTPEEVFDQLASKITSEIGFELQEREVSPFQDGLLVLYPPKNGSLEARTIVTINERGTFRLAVGATSSTVSVTLNDNEYFEGELSKGSPRLILESQYEYEKTLPIPSFQGDYEIVINWQPKSDKRTLFLWVVDEANKVQQNVAFRSEWDFTEESSYKYRYEDQVDWQYSGLLTIEDLGADVWNSWSPHLGVALELIQERGVEFSKAIEDHLKFLIENSNGSSNFNRRIPTLLSSTSTYKNVSDYALQTLPFFDFNAEEYQPIIRKGLNHVLYRAAKNQDGTLVREVDNDLFVVCEDLYSSVLFLVKAYEVKKKRKFIEQAIQQVVLFNNWLKIRHSGLYATSYNLTRESYSEEKLSLDNGRVLVALAELLKVLPEGHLEKQSIIGMFRRHAESLREFQEVDGFWKADLGNANSQVDFLGTSLIVSAFAIGVSNNWLLKDEYRRSAISGWLRLLEQLKVGFPEKKQQVGLLLAASAMMQIQE